MEELSFYYSELNLLHLKYEHLVEVGRTLFRPWPSSLTEDSSPKNKQEGQQDHHGPTSEVEPPKDPPHSKELEQLDALLSKAQELFIQPKSEETKRTDKSKKAASAIYSSGSQSTRSTKATRSSEDSRTGPSRSKPRSGSKHSGVLKVPQSEAKKEVKDIARQQDKKVTFQEENQSFFLTKQGTQLTLPSKYNKLRTLLTKCEEELSEQDALSKAAATHFSKRLTSMSPKVSSNHSLIRLQLALDQLNLLKKQLMLITPQEWTVSERSSWEDVLLVKTKVDLLIRSYDLTMAILDCKTTYTHSAQVLDGRGCPPLLHTSPEFGYTSLCDWKMLSQLQLQVRFKEWEWRFLSEARDVLLPLAARSVASCSLASSRHQQDPPHEAIAALQAIHATAGLTVTQQAFLNTATMLQ